MNLVKKFYLLVLFIGAAVIFTGCNEDDPEVVNPTFSQTQLTLEPGSSQNVIISGGTAPYSATSSAPAIATVSVEGSTLTVNAIAVGNTTIEVVTVDNGRATLSVNVTQLSLSTSSLSLDVEKSGSITISGGTAPYTVESLVNTNELSVAVSESTVTVTSTKAEGVANVKIKSSEGFEAILPVKVSSSAEQILFEDGTVIGSGIQDFYVTKSHTLMEGTYSMKGWVYIGSKTSTGNSLTIPAGTIIKGDKETKAAIIVQRGNQIFAQGTVDKPIVFTSAQPKGQRKPGDWGGIILCGRAKNNSGELTIEGGPDALHGGDNDDDNSGVLSYVRCEFAGYPFAVDQEINGITFGSVGRGTKIDHLQVSYSNDDSFEWFGGSVNCKYLIAYHGWDDDFDTDNGFSGKMQFLLGVRNPKIADTSLSNGFESDNNANGTTSSPYTTCMFSNVTLVGPVGQASDFANTSDYITGGNYNPQNGSKTGTFQAAMQIRRNSRLSCFNSVAIGYPVGLLLDNQRGDTQGAATNGDLKLKNLYFAGMTILGSDVNKSWKDLYSTDGTNEQEGKESFSHSFFIAQGNQYLNNISDLKLNQPNSTIANPNWGPTSGSPLTGKSGLFTDLSGFDQVDYIGAFKSDQDADNWMKGWANFDPQNTDY